MAIINLQFTGLYTLVGWMFCNIWCAKGLTLIFKACFLCFDIRKFSLNYIHLDKDGQSPLHRTAQAGWLDATQYLVDKGANIDLQGMFLVSDNMHFFLNSIYLDKDGQYPLHWAAKNGQFNVVQYLVEKRESIYLQSMFLSLNILAWFLDSIWLDEFGQSSPSHTSKNGHLVIVEKLGDKGANIDLQGMVPNKYRLYFHF